VSRVAIVGYSCRFPGADSPDAFWDLLWRRGNAIDEVPAWRFDSTVYQHPDIRMPACGYTFRAGIMRDPRYFDASFFGISPREAEMLDPQQRVLLELTWEALERGGLRSEDFAGTNCGVYVGISSYDFGAMGQFDRESINAYSMLGSTLSIAANRLSYVFDLHGPSLAIDTACSSAMFALAEAFEALKTGRVSSAIVGSAHYLGSPSGFIGFSKATMLSPTGLCHSFDKSADGYVRSEGGGVVILKNLNQAIADNDHIYAVLRGVAVNSDGRTPGMSMPSAKAQEALLRKAYRRARANPSDLCYIEAHGTGTNVGDPVEAAALGYALARRRNRDSPLPIGSAKSNVGHLEAASGMVGLVKALEILGRGVIPPIRALEIPNPDIPFDDLNLTPVCEPMVLEDRTGPMLVGVNSFGFGGANGHAILQRYTPSPSNAALPGNAATRQGRGLRLPIVVSAHDAEALRVRCGDLAASLNSQGAESFEAVAQTLLHRRTRLGHCLVARMTDAADAVERLTSFATQGGAEGLVVEQEVGRDVKTAFVFSGNGAQWAGMGASLMSESAVFTRAVEEVDTLVMERASWSVVDALRAGDSELLEKTEFAQPLLFAVQYGIVAWLQDHGVVPQAVAGHSVGELAAAATSGALSLAQAADVLIARSAEQGKSRGLGRMAAAEISVARARAYEKRYDGRISLAAQNSADSVTLSGDPDCLKEIGEELGQEEILFRPLNLDYAFHSRVMDEVREPFLAAIGALRPQNGWVPFYSTVTGGIVGGSHLNADYWWRNLRYPVLFGPTVRSMLGDGFGVFLEISPHPVLQSYLRRSIRAAGNSAKTVVTMQQSQATETALITAADRVFALGGKVDLFLSLAKPEYPVDLPSYPWQRQYHWASNGRLSQGPLIERRTGAYLGPRVSREARVWSALIDTQLYPELADHVVDGRILFPAAGFVELAAEALFEGTGDEAVNLEDFEIVVPMDLSDGVTRMLWLEIGQDDRLSIRSRGYLSDEPWQTHAFARVGGLGVPEQLDAMVRGKDRKGRRIAHSEHYCGLAEIGLCYGPAYQQVVSVDVEDRVARVELATPKEGSRVFRFDPSQLDGCLQAIFSIVSCVVDEEPALFVPTKVGRLTLEPNRGLTVRADVVLRSLQGHAVLADMQLYDSEGGRTGAFLGVRLTRVPRREFETRPKCFGSMLVPLRPLGEECASIGIELDALVLPAVDISEGAELNVVLNDLAARFACDLLRALRTLPGERKLDERLMKLIAEIAESAGYLSIGKGGELVVEAPEGDTHGCWRRDLERNPEAIAEFLVLARSARDLRAILLSAEGKVSGELSAFVLSGLRSDGPSSRPSFAFVGALLGELVCQARTGSRVDILEAGLDEPLLATVIDMGQEVVWYHSHEIPRPVPASEDRARDGARARYDVVVAPMGVDVCEPSKSDLEGFSHALREGGYLVLTAAVASPWWRLSFALSNCVSRGDGAAEAFMACGLAAPLIVDCGGRVVFVSRKVSSGLAGDDVVAEIAEPFVLLNLIREKPAPAVIRTLDVAAAPAEATAASANARHLVLAALDDEGIVSAHDVGRVVFRALEAVRDVASHGHLKRLTLLVRHALSEPPEGKKQESPVLLAAALWGALRVVRHEMAGVEVRSIDVGDAADDAILREVHYAAGEPEVVLGAQDRRGVRIVAAAPSAITSRASETFTKLGFEPGVIASMAWREEPRETVGDGDVEIAVKAAALNYRDVMLSIGALPPEAVESGYAGVTLGMEAAGRVVSVGKDVRHVAPGDSVLCYAGGSLSSRLVTDARSVHPVPAKLSFACAASIPVVFFTVHYALAELARLERGDRILIHGAAGGVGLAAIQFAQEAGAEVFATVGSNDKRTLVEMLGIDADRIFDSRSLDFYNDVLARTEGQGVDVVLNSLAGEAQQKSVELLRPFGRFIELGKRDIYQNASLRQRALRNNISFHVVDADQLMAQRPRVAGRVFRELVDRFNDGAYRPIPLRRFGPDRVDEAFRLLRRSGHLGKVVIEPPEEPSLGDLGCSDKFLFSGTYLVTGGCSGFGLQVALWLAHSGVERLVLLSRSGVTDDAEHPMLDAARAAGAIVDCIAGDVTDATLLLAIVEDINAGGPPLRGIVHAAAVYDDCLISSLEEHNVVDVLAPKIDGAMHLHRLSKELDLDAFVLFSSIATVVGNAGQAAYVAANMVLESIARHRTSVGLPATVVRWGPIADSGILAREPSLRELLEARSGVLAMTSRAALNVLGDVLRGGTPDVTVARVDAMRLASHAPASLHLLFDRLVDITKLAVEATEGNSLLDELRAASVQDAAVRITEIGVAEVSAILRLPAERIDVSRPIADYGVDSLMALEFSMGLERRLGQKLPTGMFATDESLSVMALRIAEFLKGGSMEAEASSRIVARSLARRHAEELGEDDIEALKR
jgi:phthiocerol/phenolphthiocerol synthesis type-I polyketide synthase C